MSLSTNTNPIKSTIAKSAEGYPLLGYCVYWTFSKMKIPYVVFQDILKESGINLDYAPETKRKTAVTFALEELKEENRKNKLRRPLIDNDEVFVQVLVHEAIDEKRQGAKYTCETKVVYYKQTGVVQVEGHPDIQARFPELVDEYSVSYTTPQIRQALINYLKSGYDGCGGLMVRENGGLYFIPSTRMGEYKKLKKAFDKLSDISAVSVDVIPIIDTKEAAKAMWQVLVGDVTEELAKLRKDVEKLRDDPSERSQEIRLTKIQMLSEKIQMYSMLMNGTADKLEKELKSINQLFLSKLAED